MKQIRSASRVCARQHTPGRIFWRWIAAILCVLLGTAYAAPAKKWTFIALGGLSNRGSMAEAINNRGDVAGSSRVLYPGSSYEVTHAFLWQNGVMQDLGPAGAFSSFVAGMNDKGTLVGSVDGKPHVWKDGTATSLPISGSAADINRGETIAGYYWTGPASRGGVVHAFQYRDGVLHDLGTLGGSHSNAAAINDKGVIVGHSDIALDRGMHAFIYEDGVMRDLGTLGGKESFATDINSHGIVVGTAQDFNGTYFAFIYDPRSGMRPLLEWGGAAAINDRGAIVGTKSPGSFLYEDGTFTSLEDIPQVRAAGWTQLFPKDINERGWITGYGLRPGGPAQGEAFLLIPH